MHNQRMRLVRFAGVAFVALVACSTPGVQWEKPGGSTSAMEADHEQCEAIARVGTPAQRYTPMPGKSKTEKIMSRSEESVRQDDERFASCMRARGYREKPRQ